MTNRAFMASIDRWQKKTIALQKKIAVASVLDVINDAQTPVAKGGSMPVDTANLRNSLVMELNSGEVSRGNGQEPTGQQAILLAITQFEIGDIIAINWTAPYARARHYKPESFGQGGGLWRDKAAAKWQSIVSKNARAAR